MKRYAIGVCGFNEDIEVVIIEAENELEAMCKVVLDKFEWNIIEKADGVPFATTDEAIDFILQGDINISKPVEI